MELQTFKKKRIESVLDKYSIDLIIGTLPENIFYLSGFKSVSHEILHRVQAYGLFYRRNYSTSLVLPCSDIATFIERFEDLEVTCYGQFYFAYQENNSPNAEKVKRITDSRYPSPDEALIEAINKTGIQKGRIGLDESRITPQIWLSIVKAFPNIEFIPAENIFSEIRMIKHHQEVHYLERAAEIAENALLYALSKAEAGMSEKELGEFYVREVVKQGGRPFFHVFTEGKRTAFVDTINTERKITDGSFLRFDIGCIYEDYRADIARTATFGKCSSKVEDYYQYILDGENRLVEHIKPGVTAKDIFHVAVEKVREGIPHYNRQHVGHGIGLEVYDPPVLGPGCDTPLEAGMVLCVETPYYELDWGGVQVEDTVVVTEDGCRLLTKSDRDLIRIGG